MPRRNLQIHCDTIMEMGVTENRGESSEVMMDSNSLDKK
jgi:hypothetical protein